MTLVIVTGAAFGSLAWAALLAALHWFFIGAARRRTEHRRTLWRRMNKHVYRRAIPQG